MVTTKAPSLAKWMLPYGRDLGQVIRNWRGKRGYSQRGLAKIIRVPVQYVSNVERGWYKAPITFCKKVEKQMDWKTRHTLERHLEIAHFKKFKKDLS